VRTRKCWDKDKAEDSQDVLPLDLSGVVWHGVIASQEPLSGQNKGNVLACQLCNVRGVPGPNEKGQSCINSVQHFCGGEVTVC